jgi:hypothetical protein
MVSKSRLEPALVRMTTPATADRATTTTTEQPHDDPFSFEDLGCAEDPREGDQPHTPALRRRSTRNERDRADVQRLLPLPGGQVYSAWGLCVFDEDPSECFLVSASSGAVSMRPLSAHERQQINPKNRLFGMVFEGRNLDTKDAFRAFVDFLQPRIERTLAPISPEQVSETTAKAIESRLDPANLPKGFWFDGRSYMDHTGVPLGRHPLFAGKLQEWVDERNRMIAEHNQGVTAALRKRAQLKMTSF